MSDRERIEQVRAMAKQLAFFLPPPARAPIADKLFGLGFRLHTELATAELSAPEGPKEMGNWRAQHVQQRSLEGFLEFADKELYERYMAAQTDEQKAVLREEIRHKYGSRIADLEKRVSAAKPEDLE
jgi:hypothetical protein